MKSCHELARLKGSRAVLISLVRRDDLQRDVQPRAATLSRAPSRTARIPVGSRGSRANP
jgi:hypothetical protein